MDRYRAYKYRSVSSEEFLNRTLDIITNRRLYCARWTDLNDPMEGHFELLEREGYEEAIEERLAKLLSEKPRFRICALSLNPYDRNMLSTYGDGHKGVIIEVELPVSESIVEVAYRSSYPEIDVLPGKIKDKAIEIFRYKHTDYAHERELRIVFDKEFYTLPSNVKSVRLGVNVGADEKRRIEDACQALDVPVYQADEDFARTEYVGNIFWLGSDLTTAFKDIQNEDKVRIVKDLSRALYHVDQLSFSDSSLQKKLEGLIAKINAADSEKFATDVRRRLASECHELKLEIAQFLIGFQSNFIREPEDWVQVDSSGKQGKPRGEDKSTDVSDHIRKELLRRRFRLYFNPAASGKSKSKVMLFGPDGEIIKGGNKNESRWRIIDGFLEFVDAEGAAHSRFHYSQAEDTFRQIDSPESGSMKKHGIQGQYMVPDA